MRDPGSPSSLRARLPRIPRGLVLLLAVALAVRVALVLATPGFSPVFDAFDYDRHAAAIADGGGYPQSLIAAEGGPSAFRPPAYPYLLGATYELTGQRYTAGRLLGAALGTLTVLLIYMLAAALWSRRMALVSGALAAGFPPLVWLNGSLASEALFLPAGLGALLAAVAFQRGGALRYAALAGALVALAALTRSNGFVLLVPVVLAAFAASALPRRRRLAAAAAAVAAFALAVAPWAARNALTFDRLTPLTTQSGYALAGTYNAVSMNAAATKGTWRPPQQDPALARELALARDEVALDAALRRRALELIGDHPGYLFEAVFLNSLRMAHPAGSPWLTSDQYAELGVAPGAEDLLTASYYAVAALAALALAGFAARRRFGGGPLWLWSAPVLLALSAVVITGAPRYRAPIDPFLLLLAAGALVAAAQRLPLARLVRRRGSAPASGALAGRPAR